MTWYDEALVADDWELTIGGEALPLSEVRVGLAIEGSESAPGAREVRLIAELDLFHWPRLAGGPAFALDALADAFEAQAISRFDPTRPARLEARLRDPGDLAAAGLADNASAADLASALHALPADAPLRRAERWALLALTQELRPGVRGGVSVRSER